MQVSAIAKARTLALIEIDELNRRGHLRFTDVLRAVVSRYDFQIAPATTDEIELGEKGVVLGSGKLRDIVIAEMKVFSGAIYIETLSSTDDSKAVFEDLFTWGTEELGFTYKPESVRRWAYISHLVFKTSFPLLASLSPPLENLAAKTGKLVSSYWEENLPYNVLNFTIGHDPGIRKFGVANFSITNRVNVPLKENKYFSEAPLPTSEHIRLLTELEQEVKP